MTQLEEYTNEQHVTIIVDSFLMSSLIQAINWAFTYERPIYQKNMTNLACHTSIKQSKNI